MTSNKSYLLNAYFHPNAQSDPLQQPRPFIRRSKVLAIKTPNLLFTELTQLSTNNNSQHKIKRDLNRQSPILIRRYRPSIENVPSNQQRSDINDVLGYQLQLTHPPLSASRNKSPRASSSYKKPLVYSKTISEIPTKHSTFNPKVSHCLQTPIWAPTLAEMEVDSTRALRSRTRSLKHYSTHQQRLQTEKSYFDSKSNLIHDLHISSKSMNHDLEIFMKTNVKDLIDEWEDPKSNVAVLSDEDDSIVTNCNDPLLTFDREIDIQEPEQFASLTSIPDQQSSSYNDNSKSKRTNLRRRPYSIALPPVVEYINDEFY